MSAAPDSTRIVEEVPGIDPAEQWFLWRNCHVEKSFSTLKAAKIYCDSRSIVYTVEYFEP